MDTVQVPDQGGLKPAAQSPPKGFGEAVHSYLTQLVVVADAKAALLMTLALAVIGVLLTVNFATPVAVIAHWAGLLLLATSGSLGAFVIFPRLPSGGTGVIFWEDILKHGSPDGYLRYVQGLDSTKVEQEYAAQNYYISVVLHKKFVTLIWEVVAFIIGALLTLIAMAIK